MNVRFEREEPLKSWFQVGAESDIYFTIEALQYDPDHPADPPTPIPGSEFGARGTAHPVTLNVQSTSMYPVQGLTQEEWEWIYCRAERFSYDVWWSRPELNPGSSDYIPAIPPQILYSSPTGIPWMRQGPESTVEIDKEEDLQFPHFLTPPDDPDFRASQWVSAYLATVPSMEFLGGIAASSGFGGDFQPSGGYPNVAGFSLKSFEDAKLARFTHSMVGPNGVTTGSEFSFCFYAVISAELLNVWPAPVTYDGGYYTFVGVTDRQPPSGGTTAKIRGPIPIRDSTGHVIGTEENALSPYMLQGNVSVNRPSSQNSPFTGDPLKFDITVEAILDTDYVDSAGVRKHDPITLTFRLVPREFFDWGGTVDPNTGERIA